MKTEHIISFPGDKQFEQHSASFELDSADLDAAQVKTLNPLEKLRLMNTMCLINGLLFQLAEGYISKEDYEARKKRLLSILPKEIQVVLMEVLRGNNATGSK